MLKPYIKICGLTDPKTAYLTAKLGANFIGVIFYPYSKRQVSVDLAKQIADATHAGGAASVGVFVEQNIDEIADIIDKTGLQGLQLNGAIVKEKHNQLPQRLIRIWTQPVTHKNYQDVEIQFNHLDKTRDFILFDYPQPGVGQSFAWDNFQYQGEMPWGVAGGLTPENVKRMMQFLNPQLIDVSSGVENSLGQKDLNLIEKFLSAIG